MKKRIIYIAISVAVCLLIGFLAGMATQSLGMSRPPGIRNMCPLEHSWTRFIHERGPAGTQKRTRTWPASCCPDPRCFRIGTEL